MSLDRLQHFGWLYISFFSLYLPSVPGHTREWSKDSNIWHKAGLFIQCSLFDKWEQDDLPLLICFHLIVVFKIYALFIDCIVLYILSVFITYLFIIVFLLFHFLFFCFFYCCNIINFSFGGLIKCYSILFYSIILDKEWAHIHKF